METPHTPVTIMHYDGKQEYFQVIKDELEIIENLDIGIIGGFFFALSPLAISCILNAFQVEKGSLPFFVDWIVGASSGIGSIILGILWRKTYKEKRRIFKIIRKRPKKYLVKTGSDGTLTFVVREKRINKTIK